MERGAYASQERSGALIEVCCNMGGEWLADQLEFQNSCPICGSVKRRILHECLTDNVFFSISGKWTLYECLHCRTGYLDPRPKTEFIARAYRNYFTHGSAKNRPESNKGGKESFRNRLAKGYLNRRYGTTHESGIGLGYFAAQLLPSLKRKLDARHRYLPKPVPGQKLLDIGCGNGQFLIAAIEAGWDAQGIEPDPKAVAAAESLGLNVRCGTLEDVPNSRAQQFDAVTLSHVIEHVANPVETLREIRSRMKEGATLFLETPNLSSFGHADFGRCWRGLEAPRHLVLFRSDALIDLMRNIGYKRIRRIRRPEVALAMYPKSELIRRSLDVYKEDMPLPTGRAYVVRILGSIFASRLEYITLTATR